MQDSIKVNNQPVKGIWVQSIGDNVGLGINNIYIIENDTGIKEQVVKTFEVSNPFDLEFVNKEDDNYIFHLTSKTNLSCRSLRGTFANYGLPADGNDFKLGERARFEINDWVYISITVEQDSYGQILWYANLSAGNNKTKTTPIGYGYNGNFNADFNMYYNKESTSYIVSITSNNTTPTVNSSVSYQMREGFGILTAMNRNTPAYNIGLMNLKAVFTDGISGNNFELVASSGEKIKTLSQTTKSQRVYKTSDLDQQNIENPHTRQTDLIQAEMNNGELRKSSSDTLQDIREWREYDKSRK